MCIVKILYLYKEKKPFLKDISAKRNTGYNLRHGNDSQLPKVHTTTYGIETIIHPFLEIDFVDFTK